MDRILPGVCSLEQHQQCLGEEPERYRPERCPGCGKAGLWAHGAYRRKADREGAGAASQGTTRHIWTPPQCQWITAVFSFAFLPIV